MTQWEKKKKSPSYTSVTTEFQTSNTRVNPGLVQWPACNPRQEDTRFLEQAD